MVPISSPCLKISTLLIGLLWSRFMKTSHSFSPGFTFLQGNRATSRLGGLVWALSELPPQSLAELSKQKLFFFPVDTAQGWTVVDGRLWYYGQLET